MPSRRRDLGTSLTKCSRGVAFVRLAKGGAAASALQMLEWPRTSHFYGQTEGGNDESISSRVRNGDVRIFLARSPGRMGTRPRRAPHGCAQGSHLGRRSVAAAGCENRRNRG